jgi:Tfp pilus assembly protein FimV
MINDERLAKERQVQERQYQQQLQQLQNQQQQLLEQQQWLQLQQQQVQERQVQRKTTQVASVPSLSVLAPNSTTSAAADYSISPNQHDGPQFQLPWLTGKSSVVPLEQRTATSPRSQPAPDAPANFSKAQSISEVQSYRAPQFAAQPLSSSSEHQLQSQAPHTHTHTHRHADTHTLHIHTRTHMVAGWTGATLTITSTSHVGFPR